MIISKTPLRISFFGGGTDYPDYYNRYGGEVISTSIDQYVYVTVSRLNPLFDHRIRVAYSKTELVRSVGDIEHPSVRACLNHLGIDGGLEIGVTTDLPARTGLGSSSSFTVGLLHALHAYQGKLKSREALGEEAIHVEQKVIGERVGSQDQIAASCGGLNRICFLKEGGFRIEPLPVAAERKMVLQSHLLLFFTGISRLAEDILDEQCSRISDNLSALHQMRSQASQACEIICDPAKDLCEFGELLHETWMLKRGLSSKVTNSIVDRAYERARSAGAIGGKLLGAGGGGFLLLFVPPTSQAVVKSALQELKSVPFAFETGGTQIVYYRN